MPRLRLCNIITPERHLIANLQPSGRHHSILLDDQNRVLYPAIYAVRKSAPKRPPFQLTNSGDLDTGRDIQAISSELSSNPYFRMLASPIRQTIHDGQYSASDFLVRLGIMQSPAPPRSKNKGEDSTRYALPDGLEHNQFKKRVNTRGFYVPCWREAFESIVASGKLKRVDPHARYHSLLTAQIHHQLRTRVIQELIVIGDMLSDPKTKTVGTQVLRRLTRREWLGVKAGHLTASVGTAGAAAILVVPQVRVRDGEASKLKSSWMDSFSAIDPATIRDIPCPQAFELVGTSGGRLHNDAQVPVYHCGAIFPRTAERMTLRLALDRILGVERKMRSQRRSGGGGVAGRRGDPLNKASDAYLLLSAQESMQRADTVPLAIALWRLRLWEGVGWTGAAMGRF